MKKLTGEVSFAARLRVGIECLLFICIHTLIMLRVLLYCFSASKFDTAMMGYAVTIALELLIILLSGDLLLRSVKGNISLTRSADRSLINVSLIVPLIHILWHFTLPSFDVTQRNWLGFFAFMLLLKSAGASHNHMQVAYTIIQWQLSGPLFLVLDYLKVMRVSAKSCSNPDFAFKKPHVGETMTQGQCAFNEAQDAPSLNSFFSYLVTEGIWFMILGLLMVLLIMTLVVVDDKKQQKDHDDDDLRNDAKRNQDQGNGKGVKEAVVPMWPLQTFGINLFWSHGRVPSPYLALYRSIDSVAQQISKLLGSSRIWLVCLPFGGTYLVRTALNRVDQKMFSTKSVSSEEWLLVMASFFFLGRESMHTDLSGLVKSLKTIRSRLSAPKQSITDLIDAVRSLVKGGYQNPAALQEKTLTNVVEPDSVDQTLQLLDLIGEGTFGKVYKGLWRGTSVAVKLLVLPTKMNGFEKRERMAIMEAAISTSLSHPNIVQTYMYNVTPILDGVPEMEVVNKDAEILQPVFADANDEGAESQCVGGFQVQLVLEYCDCGSLRDGLDAGMFLMGDGQLNYRAMLETAIDVARGMIHLHKLNIVHADIKARNVLMMRSPKEHRGVISKVSDFGLSFKLEVMETHVSYLFQGTKTHMAPEFMEHGHMGKAADVYAFGITVWELCTGKHPFADVNPAYLTYKICKEGLRPEWPQDSPAAIAELVGRCWDHDAEARPSFEEILDVLMGVRGQLGGTTPRIEVNLLRRRDRPVGTVSPVTALSNGSINVKIGSLESFGSSVNDPIIFKINGQAGPNSSVPPQRSPASELLAGLASSFTGPDSTKISEQMTE
ncbi:hypothetical protein CEUSTIGMA_g481.t1 [Chlamydomonas eustigma]|uniref:Protein kinase domain-containing protein n=1 Tax=Chlamydomonas eustigma TaxID=1157962 RepID=A0A250WQQ7_9CHLO|nr:hypothetical protein CEUSTIGMA_g481.t1 [Chlamydomonas eustigma]|eukprot:GAX73029.1 hypothetical protein CEUSTIGMA_g481.t1 [Chlamydomonas eustigma]